MRPEQLQKGELPTRPLQQVRLLWVQQLVEAGWQQLLWYLAPELWYLAPEQNWTTELQQMG